MYPESDHAADDMREGPFSKIEDSLIAQWNIFTIVTQLSNVSTGLRITSQSPIQAIHYLTKYFHGAVWPVIHQVY